MYAYACACTCVIVSVQNSGTDVNFWSSVRERITRHKVITPHMQMRLWVILLTKIPQQNFQRQQKGIFFALLLLCPLYTFVFLLYFSPFSFSHHFSSCHKQTLGESLITPIASFSTGIVLERNKSYKMLLCQHQTINRQVCHFCWKYFSDIPNQIVPLFQFFQIN